MESGSGKIELSEASSTGYTSREPWRRRKSHFAQWSLLGWTLDLVAFRPLRHFTRAPVVASFSQLLARI